MIAEDKERLIISLQDHVNNITNLRFRDTILADSLTQRLKRIAKRYFPESDFWEQIDKIRFKSTKNSNTYPIEEWREANSRLLTVAQAMLDEVQFPQGELIRSNPYIVGSREKGLENKKLMYAIAFFIISSLLMWTFNIWVKWNWLMFHPKRLAIYLSSQLAIIFITSLFLTQDKQFRLMEWIGIAVTIALAIISFLV